MADMRKEFIRAALEDMAYDFIAQNYYVMDKADLKTIILELLWALDHPTSDYIDELKDIWEME